MKGNGDKEGRSRGEFYKASGERRTLFPQLVLVMRGATSSKGPRCPAAILHGVRLTSRPVSASSLNWAAYPGRPVRLGFLFNNCVAFHPWTSKTWGESDVRT